MEGLKPGQLVRSKAGRDKGRHYLVLKILDATRVLLVDGRRRPLDRPKEKNVLHLQPYKRWVNLDEELAAGELTDSRLVGYLEQLISREVSVQRKEG